MAQGAFTGCRSYAFHKFAALICLAGFKRFCFGAAGLRRFPGELAAIERIGNQEIAIAGKVRIAFQRPAFFSHSGVTFTPRFLNALLLRAIADVLIFLRRRLRNKNTHRYAGKYKHHRCNAFHIALQKIIRSIGRQLGHDTANQGSNHQYRWEGARPGNNEGAHPFEKETVNGPQIHKSQNAGHDEGHQHRHKKRKNKWGKARWNQHLVSKKLTVGAKKTDFRDKLQSVSSSSALPNFPPRESLK